MKRTRLALRSNKASNDVNNKLPKGASIEKQPENEDNTQDRLADQQGNHEDKNIKTLMNDETTSKKKLKLKKLLQERDSRNEDFKPNVLTVKGRPRAVVDLETMKKELKQLEDPPITNTEKQLSSLRLPLSFYDIPCEELAQNLLGRVLVRRLENGTILKGRIVETESYLGGVDKASQSYLNRVTPRNLPMYMQPGTIYVYLTYGMYHCFNISCQEPGTYVLVRAVEPICNLQYMELLRNTRLKVDRQEKEMVQDVGTIDSTELCNDPFKLCTAFFIERDALNGKELQSSTEIWLERDLLYKSVTIVSAPRVGIPPSEEAYEINLSRFYILGNACVSQRDIPYEDRAYKLHF
ncbi:uncharacterized protein LOC105695161 isoform X3 [Orussus abietinus]|nr:uncharacterized protein LOC105695161 isoform X3 [Orussus abietinus]XP_012271924.1 uncharacterized protein LOC105695161 isoform X3 [Orussus abietinus]XP_012271925.1 uncharacterized protein LOC105695161 isoform X3 [Orussus abietinus]